MAVNEHALGLAALGVAEGQIGALSEYLDLVASWNERTNLTGASSPSERVRVLVADAWGAAALPAPGALIDVGSGNGSPGLVLALLRPDLHVTLLEPRARRWAFLREAVRRLGFEDRVGVERCRCEDYPGRAARTVSIRGLKVQMEVLASLVEPGGDVLVFGGSPEAAPPIVSLGTYPSGESVVHVYRRLSRLGVSRET